MSYGLYTSCACLRAVHPCDCHVGFEVFVDAVDEVRVVPLTSPSCWQNHDKTWIQKSTRCRMSLESVQKF